MAAASSSARARRALFGHLPDGRAVEAVTLANGRGMSARIIAYGAALQQLIVPDRDGRPADVALGFSTIEDYLAHPLYFGATVGRVANRIAGGRFMLDGKTYRTPLNDGANTLHGGAQGFDKLLWDVAAVEAAPTPSVTLRLVSPDGDQGFPGTLTVTATYALDDTGTLSIDYRATTDRPTIVNISNHSYWNVAGEGSADGAMGHVLTIPADFYTPTDAAAIPTGGLSDVTGTAFDFRAPIPVGARVRDAGDAQIGFGRGYDHNWAVDSRVAAEPRLLARLEEPACGRVLEILSNQPGLQFYSGNFLDATVAGKSGRLYRQGDAIVLEPQMFPDTPNRPQFGSVRLDPGETYRNLILFRFSTGAARE